jgi:hypothetical protein
MSAIRILIINCQVVDSFFSNIVGQEVTTLVEEEMKAGYYFINRDSRSSSGMSLPSGVYFEDEQRKVYEDDEDDVVEVSF